MNFYCLLYYLVIFINFQVYLVYNYFIVRLLILYCFVLIVR
uniref:Uncharacterized protein n=1 Tax=Kapraunia schneideri TaxID=717899 RepID=A0A1Z1MT41_9FLOR|nr:hypothetical protein [Kapraunia schneideri]ARW68951.1 hypothetical protein [Kapraunia schneideri]